MFEKTAENPNAIMFDSVHDDGKDFASLSTTKLAAEQACLYTRDLIRNGSTWLKNNTDDELGFLQRKSLMSAVAVLRALWQDPNATIFDSQLPENLYRLKRLTNPVKKFGIGNCMEMAFIAFEYILENTPSVYAEVYVIAGGDHAFLVVGRQVNSDPSDPATWGENAYICDPWADKVYLASEYLDKLENFYSEARDIHVGCMIAKVDSEPTMEKIQEKEKYQYLVYEDRFWYYDCAQALLTEIDYSKDKPVPTFLTELAMNEPRVATLNELTAVKGYLGHNNTDLALCSEAIDPKRHKLATLPFLNTNYYGKLQTVHHFRQYISTLSFGITEHSSSTQSTIECTLQLIEGLISSLIRKAEEMKQTPPSPTVSEMITTSFAALRQLHFFKREVNQSGSEQPQAEVDLSA